MNGNNSSSNYLSHNDESNGNLQGSNPTENHQSQNHLSQNESDDIVTEHKRLLRFVEKEYSKITKAIAESQQRITEMTNKSSAKIEAANILTFQFQNPEFENAVKNCFLKFCNEMGVVMHLQKRPANLSFASTSHDLIVPPQQQSNGTNQTNGPSGQHQIIPTPTPTPTSTAAYQDQRRLSAATPMPLLNGNEPSMTQTNMQNAQQRLQQQPSHQQLPQQPSTTQVPTSASQWLQQLRPSFPDMSPPSNSSHPRMPFSSPTTMLPPPPMPPSTLQSPAFPRLPGPPPPSTPTPNSSSSQQPRCQRPFCCIPPSSVPPNLSLEQYQAYLACVFQNRPRFPPPPSSMASRNSFIESLRPSGNPYLQQFPRLPLDPQEHERLNQMFYANVLRPQSQQPPPSSQGLPAHLQHPPQLQQQPPQTTSPLPSRRTRKRKKSPERCVSTISTIARSETPRLNDNNNVSNNSNLFLPPLAAPGMTVSRTNSGPSPLFACVGPPIRFQQQDGGAEKLINVVQNPNAPTTETGNNQNGDDEVIILEQEQHHSNQSLTRSSTRPSTACLETPPSSKLYIADDDDEEEENENEKQATKISKTKAIPLPPIPPATPKPLQNLSSTSARDSSLQAGPAAAADSSSIPTSPVSSPTISEVSTRATPEFNLTKIQPLIDAHFADKPMLRSFYTILQERRPNNLPKYLNTIGLAHNLQDQKRIAENLLEFGKVNAENLYASERSKRFTNCSKCHKSDIPLPNFLISNLSQVGRTSSKDALKELLMKIVGYAAETLGNAVEKVMKLNQPNVGSYASPKISIELEDAANDALKAADNYEKCSVIWNPEPLKDVKVNLAHDIFKMSIITEDEKLAILNEAECEHRWIRRRNSRRSNYYD